MEPNKEKQQIRERLIERYGRSFVRDTANAIGVEPCTLRKVFAKKARHIPIRKPILLNIICLLEHGPYEE